MMHRGIFVCKYRNSNVKVPYSDTLNVTDKLSVFIWAKKTTKEQSAGLMGTLHSYKEEGQFDIIAGWNSTFSFVELFFEDDTKVKFDNAVWDELEWTMIGFTFNSETGIVRTITNGEIYEEYSGYNKRLHPMESDLYIGSRRFDTFTGWICNALIYNRELTEGEIRQLYKEPFNPPRDGLILWIPFSENMGVIAKDYSCNNNHARLYNCKWVSRARRGMYFDNGGIKFDSGLNIDCNYCSVVAVFAIETPKKGGDTLNGKNCIIRPENEMLMLFNNPDDKKLRFTNYDRAWKEIVSNIELEAGQIYTGVGIMNGNEEHIYLASNGVIIDHNYRDDVGDCGEYTDTAIYVGSRGDGKYALHGEVLAVMIYDRPISENEIKQISDLGWFNPPRNGLISWILFDGLKEGDEVKDLITGAIGEPIGTPKFVIRKPKRVLTR